MSVGRSDIDGEGCLPIYARAKKIKSLMLYTNDCFWGLLKKLLFFSFSNYIH